MLSELRPALIVTRREIRDQFRDWRIIMPIVVLTLFFPGLMNFAAERVVNYVEQFNVPLIGDRLIPYLLMVVGFFPISVSLVIALESFVGEKERRSIEPLLSSPLSDLQLYLGKLFAVILPPLLASYLGITVYLIGVHRQVGWSPEPTLLIQVLILSTVQALVMVSGAVVISSQTTSARAANLLSSFIIVPMAILLIGESMVMFWARYNVLWWAIIGQLFIAGLLVRTGIAHFNREELLGRELDTLNFKWGWQTFWRAFTGQTKSVREWYRQLIDHTRRRLGLPILVMGISVIAGYLLGVRLADIYVIPAELLDIDAIRGGFIRGVEGFDTIRFFSFSSIGTVWVHNLRAIILAALLGIFSFGVLGIVVLMLPFTLIGYFVATIANTGMVTPLTFLSAFILPHGIVEIPAIIISGAAILRMGATLATPAPGHTIGEALLLAFANWARIIIGLIMPLFLLSAIVEVFITPQVVTLLLGNG